MPENLTMRPKRWSRWRRLATGGAVSALTAAALVILTPGAASAAGTVGGSAIQTQRYFGAAVRRFHRLVRADPPAPASFKETSK